MNEATKKFVSMSIWLTLILFAVRCLVDWASITGYINEHKIAECAYSLFGYAGEAIGIASIFMFAFDKWLWKWKPLNMIAGGMPILAKKYHGTIIYNWNNTQGTREADIRIDQTFLKVFVRLGTDESSSNSVIGTITTVNNEKQLVYTYLNTPRAEIQNRSAIHYGTAMLNVDDPTILKGNYYTSRLTCGSIELKAS